MILLQSLLEFLGLDQERLLVQWISGNEGIKFQETVEGFTEKLKKLGPADKVRDTRCSS
jgi:coenzyme F420-reducing hydrogenase delta subunit